MVHTMTVHFGPLIRQIKMVEMLFSTYRCSRSVSTAHGPATDAGRPNGSDRLNQEQSRHGVNQSLRTDKHRCIGRVY